jgi:diguanylate cyclase (GGDEF)-like protein
VSTYRKGSTTSEDVGAPISESHKKSSASALKWSVAFATLVLLGALGSLVGANAVSNSEKTHSLKDFSTSSSQIAATLRLTIEHEQDLVDSTESLLLGNPHATETQFRAWANDLRVLKQYPGLTGLEVINYVTTSQVGAYLERASKTAKGVPTVELLGLRPFYCFSPLAIAKRGEHVAPYSVDFCDGPTTSFITGPRSSGQSEIMPYQYLGRETIEFGTPIYGGGVVPSTVAARERKFVEIIALNLVPTVILHAALVGHQGFAIALSYHGPSSTLVFHQGVIPRGAQTASINIEDGWTVRTFAVRAPSGLLGDGSAPVVLFGGLALSLLLATVIYLLGTGRSRSMLLVGERTEQLQHQALHDILTGLPNRALIVDRIEQLLERNRRHETQGAALYIDLDDFKNVNDSLGHGVGDNLLISVAQRMKSALRGADTIGRMGGDEFVVLVDGGNDEAGPDHVAHRLLDVMRQPLYVEGANGPLTVNVSIGVAIGDRNNADELLRDAGVALYQAKAMGKNQFVVFDDEMRDDVGRRISLEFDLRSALADRQFYLAYQPIYNLEDLSIVGVEALLRWRHPIQGVVQPNEFIPILEKTGAIREVGAWVLNEACSQMVQWHALGNALDMSVNVSARQLDDELFVSQVSNALIASGLDATSLIIEMTETALMQDINSSVARLEEIRALGVRIAIDDFGTGYSSLSHLRQIPVDSLKIDQSFTAALTTSDESKALVKTFIQLGKDLGLGTVAEGVETMSQVELLRENNVGQVQGYLFSRPLDPEAFEVLLFEQQRTIESFVPPMHS